MSAEQGYQAVARSGIVAVFRGNFPPQVALAAAEVLVREGITALEFTTNSIEAFDAMQAVRAAFGADVVVGMGTVLDTATAQRALDAGAQMIVSPAFDRSVIALVQGRDVLAIPGVITATEAVNAWMTGARLLKLFPIGPLGLDYFKALRAPLDHIAFMCNGGTDDTNVGDFISAGAVACGIGGWLTGDGTSPIDIIQSRARIIRQVVDDARAARPASISASHGSAYTSDAVSSQRPS